MVLFSINGPIVLNSIYLFKYFVDWIYMQMNGFLCLLIANDIQIVGYYLDPSDFFSIVWFLLIF